MEYYEHPNGSVGLKFPMGIGAGELAKRIAHASRRRPVRKHRLVRTGPGQHVVFDVQFRGKAYRKL